MIGRNARRGNRLRYLTGNMVKPQYDACATAAAALGRTRRPRAAISRHVGSWLRSVSERHVVVGARQRAVDAVRTLVGDRHRGRIGSARSIGVDRCQAMLERLKAATPGARLILRGT